MRKLQTLDELNEIYAQPVAAAVTKVAPMLTPLYRKWIEASRFCMLCTVGPDRVDGSPRGDDGPVVKVLDAHQLALPDWRGNNRIDSLSNIVRDPRVSLVFFVPGSNNVIRVIGQAYVTDDAEMRARFSRKDTQPATVTIITINEVYSQCARAMMRARLWTSADESGDIPTVGQMIEEASQGASGGDAYDAAWLARAKTTMW